MTIVNGHEAETGCYLDGHWGWHNHVRMLELAEDYGWEIDAELRTVMERYDAGNECEPDDPQYIADAMDEAERWLNDHTASGCGTCGVEVIWHDDANAPPVEWVHAPEHLERACGDPQPRHYVWHWHDGEFFLSPICDDPGDAIVSV